VAASFVLSWVRPQWYADLTGKPSGRIISDYPSLDYDAVKATAEHINSIDPSLDCEVHTFTS
jgi:hypothetical protein